MFWRSAPQVLVVNGSPTAATQIDPAAVWKSLEARVVTADALVSAVEDYLQADAEYKAAFNEALIGASGPEYVRRAVAEQAAAGARATRDVAEAAKVAAEQAVRLAELGWRSAMAGAAPDGGES